MYQQKLKDQKQEYVISKGKFDQAIAVKNDKNETNVEEKLRGDQ